MICVPRVGRFVRPPSPCSPRRLEPPPGLDPSSSRGGRAITGDRPYFTGRAATGGRPYLTGAGDHGKFAPNFRHTLEQLFIPAYFFVAPGPADVCYMDSGGEARSMAVGDKNHLAGRKESKAEGFEEALFAKRSRYLIENKGKLFSRRLPRLAGARRDTTGTGPTAAAVKVGEP